MQATTFIQIHPRSAVPAEPAARVAWLDEHPVCPESALVKVAAPLATWARLGCTIREDGRVELRDTAASYLAEAALDLVHTTGAVPETLPADVVERLAKEMEAALEARRQRLLAQPAAYWIEEDRDGGWRYTRHLPDGPGAERPGYTRGGQPEAPVGVPSAEIEAAARAEVERRTAAKKQAEAAECAEIERRTAAKEQAQAAYSAEREAWVRERGSERLRAALEVGLLAACDAVYRDERLADARPGWEWESESTDVREVRNPTLEQLQALAEARTLYPAEPGTAAEVALVYLYSPCDHREHRSESEEERECPDTRQDRALRSTYLDQVICRRV